jgi:tetratricopeptide (TPR) repeat protein
MRHAVALTLLASGFWWWRTDPDVEQGNAKVQAGNFDEALADFDRAQAALTEEEQKRQLDFNRGLALHGAGKLDDAQKAFSHAGQSTDPTLRSRAAFNEGNVAQQRKDKDAATQAYIRSLRADPTYEPARRNLELLLSQPPPPPPDGGEGGGDGGGNPDGGDGADGGGKGDGGGGGGDGGPQDGGGQGGADGSPQDNTPPPMDQPQKPDEQPQQVNEQDAMKILDAMRDQEKNRPLGRIMLKDNRPPKADKPW